MATPIRGSSISKTYGETVSLTTTAAHLAFMPKYHEVLMYCASAFRMGLAPKLASVQYYSASGGTYTNYTTEATDRSSSTHVPLDAMAATDYLYLGVTEPVRGFYFDIGTNAQATGSRTLDWEYMSALTSAGVATFTDVAGDSDGTSGSTTLDQDGLYSFTLVAAGTVLRGRIAALNTTKDLYWYRFCPSGALSATVDVNEIIPVCDTVNYGYFQGGISYQFSINPEKEGAFEFDHTSSDTLYVTWLRH